jgi:hypothetical protein
MQIAIRSYVTAGVAAAGVAALVVAPIAPKMDVSVPSVNAAVALAASPFEQALIYASTAPIDLVAGLINSTQTAAVAYPSLGLQVGLGLAQQIQALIGDPASIPDFFAELPTQANQIVSLGEVNTFGVATGLSGNGAPGVTDVTQLAGPFAPQFFPAPPYLSPVVGQTPAVSPGAIPGNISNGLNSAAAKVDGVIAAVGGPPVFVQTVSRSTQAIGTSFIQAQGLVRSSMLNAITGVNLAVVHGGNVNAAIQNGLTSVQQSILGNPAAAAGSVARLGAIKTVTHTVQKAVKDVGTAARGGHPTP